MAKVLAVFVIPTLLLVVVYGGLAYFAGSRGLEDELGSRLVAIGQAISAEMSDGFEAKQLARLDADKTRTIENFRERLQATRDRTGVRRIYIFDESQTSLVDTDETVRFGDRLYALEADQIELKRTFEEGATARSVLFTADDGTRYKIGYAPISLEGETIAAIGVEGSAEYFDVLTEFSTALSFIGVLGLLGVIFAGTLFARRITRPVNRLVDEARRLGRGEWDESIAPPDADPNGDEIAFLAHTFDEMRRDVRNRDHQMQMMLSGIAHEVRNPLGGMELFCGLLEEDIRAGDDPDKHDKLDKVGKIQRELGYLERVVTDFLDFAREVPLDLERFQATEFASEIQELMHGEVVDAGATLSFEVEDGAELTVDRTRIRRAVINVIRNAYQAMSEPGEIRVSIAEDGPERVISVTDSGPGIPAEQLEEILTPFFTTKEKGSGLGLALTQNIVHEHGGTMRVDSEPGVGTTIEFRLPFDESMTASSPEIPEGWLG